MSSIQTNYTSSDEFIQPVRSQLAQNVFNSIGSKDGSFDVCLVCLNPNVDCDDVKINVNIITDIYDVKVSLENIIKTLFNIKNIEDECISTLVCTKCCHRLTECYKFVQHFKSCQSIVKMCLDQLIDKLRYIDTIPIKIKKEDQDDTSTAKAVKDEIKSESTVETGHYECTMCTRDFGTGVDLKVHRDQHSETDKHLCRQCGRTFNRITYLKHHKRRVHMYELKECQLCKALIKPHLMKRHHDQHMKLHTCDLCGVSFKERFTLVSHKHFRHNIVMFDKLQCPKCGDLIDKPRYAAHVKNHTRVQCKICQKYIQSTRIKRHIIEHTKAKKPQKRKHKCEECGLMFHGRYALDAHINRYHKNIKPYECRHCGRTFYCKGNCHEHEKTHKEKVYTPCEKCGAKLLTRKGYRNHMMSHNNIKAYKCDFCPASYVSASARKEHTKRNHKEQYDDWSKIHREKISYKNPEILDKLKAANLLPVKLATDASDYIN